jgi:predicted RNase H-like HicB family nuclease
MDLMVIPNTDASGMPGMPPFDLNVMHGRLRVGRIRRESALSPPSQWIWVVSVYDGPEAMHRSGMAATVEEAQAALKDNWQQWLVWAGLIEREVATDESSGAQADSQGNDLTAVLREAHLAARG